MRPSSVAVPAIDNIIATSAESFNPISLKEKISRIQADIEEAYFEKTCPWVIAYSGGKDSTMVLQLVCEFLLSLPKDKHNKEIHIVSNDTRVESPVISQHLDKSLELLKKFQQEHSLPIKVQKTVPADNDSFWVNLIGRGYIPPTRVFRWCTSKMKIEPTNKYIKNFIDRNGEVVLLLGVRTSESTSRGRSIRKHTNDDGTRYNPHSMMPKCLIYRPIIDIENEEIWQLLLQRPSLWGGNNRELITIYRNAAGGECPTVLSEDDAPSCGSSSVRFGCWTCTVISKDRSLGGLVDSGLDYLGPYMDFRDWLIELREDDDNRTPVRRNGRWKKKENGSMVKGPFLISIRKEIYSRLLELEKEVGEKLLTKSEIFLIERIWRQDEKKAIWPVN